jgi:hypothetical protein
MDVSVHQLQSGAALNLLLHANSTTVQLAPHPDECECLVWYVERPAGRNFDGEV